MREAPWPLRRSAATIAHRVSILLRVQNMELHSSQTDFFIKLLTSKFALLLFIRFQYSLSVFIDIVTMKSLAWVVTMVPTYERHFENLISSGMDKYRLKRKLSTMMIVLNFMRTRVAHEETPQEIREMYHSLRARLAADASERFKRKKPIRRGGSIQTRGQQRSNPIKENSIRVRRMVCIPRELCPVCRDMVHDMVETKCRHLFCQDCITQSAQNRLTCPVCRGPLD